MTLAFRGKASCPHSLASGAGVEIRKAGGSAVAAAMAASAVLSVVYPHMTGVGDSPRWLSGCFVPGDPRDLLNLEGRLPERTLAELERRGHAINRWDAWSELARHAHGITVDPETGALVGGFDPRSDGAAIAY